MATSPRKRVALPKVDVVNNESVSDDGEFAITPPYTVTCEIEGTAKLLFHAWSVEGVEAKAKAAKGSAAKKTDDVESYVYRDENNMLCVPGEYLRQSIIHAAKFRQDPRSPRKSAMDLFKAGVVSLTELAPLGTTTWDHLDRRRVKVQMSAVTRERPCMMPGWKASFDLQVLLPEYIEPRLLRAVLQDAGRLVGIADFRPTFGRFDVVTWKEN